MKYKIYYTYTETEAVVVEAKDKDEAIDKFWDDDYLSKETIMDDNNVMIEQVDKLNGKSNE